MITEVRTPFGTPTPIELSKDGLYRKQILRFCTIDYTDRDGSTRKITFDEEYGRDLVQAFKDGAYNQVPFQLADNDNRHNNSPLLTGGEAVALTLSRDGSGVDAILKLNNQGQKAVELNPKIGVSARILEDAVLGGKPYRRAVQHVLATVDPQIRDMSPWEKVRSVDLSDGTVSVSVDLSTATYERSATMPQGNGDTVTLELSAPVAELLSKPGAAERLAAMIEEDEGLEALAAQLGDLLDDEEEDDEDDLADLYADDDPDDDDPDVTDLSGRAVQALELANARTATMESRVIELTNQLAKQRLDTELAAFRREGLAPAVLEAAAPLLSIESGALELSNSGGQAVDPGEVVRGILSTVIELAASGHLIVGDGDETGTHHAEDPAASRRDALLADWSTEYGN